jgi:hypothetical protein
MELASVAVEIEDKLKEKNLQVNLSGKWLGRALNISQFALRVIGSPRVALEQLKDEKRGSVSGTLYRGLSPDVEVNTAVYWQSVLAQLQPEPTDYTTIIG